MTITKSWAFSLLKRMNFVLRKGATSKNKFQASNFAELKQSFLNDVVTTVTMEEILPELILKWDQTGVKIIPSYGWTMDQQDVSNQGWSNQDE